MADIVIDEETNTVLCELKSNVSSYKRNHKYQARTFLHLPGGFAKVLHPRTVWQLAGMITVAVEDELNVNPFADSILNNGFRWDIAGARFR